MKQVFTKGKSLFYSDKTHTHKTAKKAKLLLLLQIKHNKQQFFGIRE